MAGAQADGKMNLFSSRAKKYWDELCISEAGIYFELFCLHCALDKVIWLLVFLAWYLLPALYSRPQSIPI